MWEQLYSPRPGGSEAQQRAGAETRELQGPPTSPMAQGLAWSEELGGKGRAHAAQLTRTASKSPGGLSRLAVPVSPSWQGHQPRGQGWLVFLSARLPGPASTHSPRHRHGTGCCCRRQAGPFPTPLWLTDPQQPTQTRTDQSSELQAEGSPAPGRASCKGSSRGHFPIMPWQPQDGPGQF